MEPKSREPNVGNCQSGEHLSVLHVASFHGNVGDNASHNGLYASFFEATGYRLIPRGVEVRRGYQNYAGSDRLNWEDEVIGGQAECDLTLIGGGNFFTPRIDHSPSGTTIGLGPAEIRKVAKPLVFHGIGFDPHQGSSPANQAKFREFLEETAANPSVAVYFRNDGSRQNLLSCYGESVAEKAQIVPDPGFFVDVGDALPGGGLGFDRYIAVNVAKDMLETRFCTESGYREFLNGFARFLERACEHLEMRLVLVPHIWSDVEAASDLLGLMHDRFRRSRVALAPLLTGPGAEKVVFGIYRDAELVLGPRFHTNVCSIGMGVPTLGIASYRKLTDLYNELGLSERCLSVSQPDLWGRAWELTVDAGGQGSEVSGRYRHLRETLWARARQVHLEILRLVLRGSGGAERMVNQI